jgi:cytochrome P450
MGRDAKLLSLWDTLRFQWYVAIPGSLLGIVAANPVFVSRFARRDRARRTHRFIRELRARYRSELLWLWFPIARTLLVLSPAAIDDVLASEGSASDPWLKKRAISRFAPGALVATADAATGDRRSFNTGVLDLGRLHRHAHTFLRIAAGESRALVGNADTTLRWPDFQSLGKRISQQLVLGDGRRDDALDDDLARLLRRANLLLRDEAAFGDLHRRIDASLDPHAGAPDACLVHAAAGALAEGRASAATCVSSQVAFWCFVLKDAVELHASRTLALIAAHPQVQAKARAEIHGAGALSPQSVDGLRYLEACIIEGLRLWTPVPLLLRAAAKPCVVGGETVGPGRQMLIHAGFRHRDRRVFGRVADAFAPDEAAEGRLPPVYVFSAHGRSCAGESLVRFVLKGVLATMLAGHRFELANPAIVPGRIPHLVDHFGIALRARPDAPVAALQR